MPNFIHLPSGRWINPAHIMLVVPDGNLRISVKFADGSCPVFLDDDARAIADWLYTIAVEVQA